MVARTSAGRPFGDGLGWPNRPTEAVLAGQQGSDVGSSPQNFGLFWGDCYEGFRV